MHLFEVFRSSSALLALEVSCVLLILLCARFEPSRLKTMRVRTLGSQAVASFRHFAERRTASVVAVGMLALCGRLVLLGLVPAPLPGVHDEFSYLLAGETFAAGRMTNPPSPYWKNFETFHEIQKPSFSSMYPPAQGLFLAAGKFLTGNLWAGVCLSVALFCAFACWMLQGWLPPSWALLGGIFTVLRYGLVGYWVNSYWGGAVAALGAMLVLGSVPRLFKGRWFSAALASAIGVLLLESSRPYEGSVFCAALLAWMGWRFLKSTSSRKRRVIVPFVFAAAPILLLGQLATLRYFAAVTGNPFTMPYVLNAQQYLISRPFIWQPLQPEPAYRHKVMQRYYEKDTVDRYQQLHTARGLVLESGNKLRSLVLFYAWPGILLIGFAIGYARKLPELWLCGWVALVLFLALSVEEWPMHFHYAAPMASVALLATMLCLRAVWKQSSLGWCASRLPAFFYTALCMGALLLRLGAPVADATVTAYGWVPWATDKPGNVAREHISQALQNTPGKHLVFVHYGANHDPSTEWVYNGPDLQNAKVLWARELSPEDDAAMARHFKDRVVWEIDPDRNPAKLACVSGIGSQIVAATLPPQNRSAAAPQDRKCDSP